MNCRFCRGGVIKAFSDVILNKYNVNYWKCESCGSLQTDEPFWLQEAYSDGNLTYLDVGVIQRNINNFSIIAAVARLADVHNILDYGGGDGLLCRNLRDIGLNAYVSDKYASLSYVKGFDTPDFSRPDLSVAFEVVEHFANPADDLKQIFSHQPNYVILSTVLYNNQNSGWWYLSKDTGQHVFFYTREAMRMIANEYNYQIIFSSDYVFFYKKIGRIKRKLIKNILSQKWRKFIRIWAVNIPAIGLEKDYQFLMKNFKND